VPSPLRCLSRFDSSQCRRHQLLGEQELWPAPPCQKLGSSCSLCSPCSNVHVPKTATPIFETFMQQIKVAMNWSKVAVLLVISRNQQYRITLNLCHFALYCTIRVFSEPPTHTRVFSGDWLSERGVSNKGVAAAAVVVVDAVAIYTSLFRHKKHSSKESLTNLN